MSSSTSSPSGPYLQSIATVAARHGLTRAELADLTAHVEDVPDHLNATVADVERALAVCQPAWRRRAAAVASQTAARDLHDVLAGRVPSLQAVGVGADERGAVLVVYVARGARLPSGVVPTTFGGLRVQLTRIAPIQVVSAGPRR